MKHIGTQPLETGRLWLRRLEPGDAPGFFDMMSDERVTRFLVFPRLVTPEQAVDVIEKDLALYEKDPSFYLWAVVEKESGRFAGAASLRAVNEKAELGEAAYAFTHAMWGRGYAAETLRALLGFAFREAGFNRIEAWHSTQNAASGKVMRKAGMFYEGMARERYKNHLGYHDCHLYGMLKRDF